MSFCIVCSFFGITFKKALKDFFCWVLFLSIFINLLLFSDCIAAMIHARAAVAVDAETGVYRGDVA